MLLENKELMFQVLDLCPIPIEIYAPDGTVIFCNHSHLQFNNVTDVNLVLGKYNVLKDPVCNDQMGMRNDIQRVFCGEPFVRYDVILPVQDLLDRGVIDEKPFEKAYADWYLYPIMNGEELAFVVFIYIIKKLYYGRPDLARAKEYLDNHWLEDFNPPSLAKYVNISVTQLYKIFKEHTGMTPGDYYKKNKIEHIKKELANENLSVKQAFAICGEDSQSRMARVFKKMTGMSPREYRENLNNR